MARNLHDSQAAIEDLVMDLDDLETDYASIKALRKAAPEFETYIANNKDMIPNYADADATASASPPVLSKAPSTRWSEGVKTKNRDS